MITNQIILILVAILGATSTFHVSTKLKFGPVKSSALLSLIVGILFFILKDKPSVYLATKIPLAFLGASFVGMTSEARIKSLSLIALSGLIFGIVFLFIQNPFIFTGFGGGLGTSAFLSVLATLGIQKFISKLN